MQPAMIEDQSNAIQAVSKSKTKSNNPVKQRPKEMTKKVDINFQKMRIYQALFAQKKLQKQMKEPETKQQLLEEDRELERKIEENSIIN